MFASEAGLVIMPVQDILGLGSEARMNTPGTVEGNWLWRMGEPDAEAEKHWDWLRQITRETGRFR